MLTVMNIYIAERKDIEVSLFYSLVEVPLSMESFLSLSVLLVRK